MNIPFTHNESKLIHSKVHSQKMKFYEFFSHKQKQPVEVKYSAEEKYKYQLELKHLIHQWLKFQNELKSNDHSVSQGRQYFSLNLPDQKDSNNPRQSSRIQSQSQYQDQNTLSQQLIHYIYQNHPIFKRINFNLTQTLINIGTFTLYGKGDQILHIFFEQKQKNQCNEKKRLGIVMYGRLKLFSKVENYAKTIDQNDSIGEHGIQTLGINYPDYRNVRVKSIADETAILWINKRHYQVLFKESMKCGLKQQTKKFESHLKLSWIKKAIKKQ